VCPCVALARPDAAEGQPGEGSKPETGPGLPAYRAPSGKYARSLRTARTTPVAAGSSASVAKEAPQRAEVPLVVAVVAPDAVDARGAHKDGGEVGRRARLPAPRCCATKSKGATHN
jgi:hypothetical protein